MIKRILLVLSLCFFMAPVPTPAETINLPGILLPWTNSRTVTADTTVVASDGIIYVDASAGATTITYPPALTGGTHPVWIVKIDTTANIVTVSDGTNTVDKIVTAASALGQIGGWREVYSNGTNLRSMGAG